MVAVGEVIVELRFRPRFRIWKIADILLLQFHHPGRFVTDRTHRRIFDSPGHHMAIEAGGVRDLGARLQVRIACDHRLLSSWILMAIVAFEFLRLGLPEHASDRSRVRRVLEFRVVDPLSAARVIAPGLALSRHFLRGGVGQHRTPAPESADGHDG